jgi:hypothetical protein
MIPWIELIHPVREGRNEQQKSKNLRAAEEQKLGSHRSTG